MKSMVLILSLAGFAFGAPCDNLSGALARGGTVTTSELVSNGEVTIAGRTVRDLPPFCRVAGVLKPSADSDIRFEVWLPTNWNGKFQGIGNGGYAGTITYSGLIDAVKNGYASASTDTGHQETVNTSAAWALNHPEKAIDFGYRAIHETAVVAKSLITTFYGQAPKRSYFNSCSNGGRQALMEAQRFPEDYDGILAGAPANDWSHLLSSAASGVKAILSEPASYFPASKLPAIQAAAQAQCDANDGSKDGVIENPLACKFDPSVLVCKDAESDSCLTRHQVAALSTIYGGLKDGSGKPLFPGLSPGGEAEQGGWAPWITGTAPEKGAAMYAFGTQFFKNFVYSDPNWNFRTFDPDRDLQAAIDRTGKYMDAVNADLSAFQKRGGKLILYHGWADAAIPGTNAVNYYTSVQKKMGEKTAADFVRLYMVPGMQHCAGGAGASSFGQAGTPNGDRFHSIDAALEAWVEQSQAPDSLIASRPANAATARTHPLCPWPQIAKYKGSGSPEAAESFACAKP